MPKSFEKPVGYIKLTNSSTQKRNPVFINMERICCFGVDTEVDEKMKEIGSWIALSGRERLIYVSELPSEITAAIEAARNEYRI